MLNISFLEFTRQLSDKNILKKLNLKAEICLSPTPFFFGHNKEFVNDENFVREKESNILTKEKNTLMRLN